MTEIVTTDVFVPSTACAGMQLHVRIKRLEHCNSVPVLILHGQTLGHALNDDLVLGGESIADIMAKLGVNCYLLDVRGYGLSSVPEEVVKGPIPGSVGTFDDWVEDIEDVIRYFDFDRFEMISVSNSCYPAMIVAARYPDKVRKLIINGFQSLKSNKSYSEWTPMTCDWYDNDRYLARMEAGIPKDLVTEIMPQDWQDVARDMLGKHAPEKYPLGLSNDAILIRTGKAKLSDWVDVMDIKANCMFICGQWEPEDYIKEFYQFYKDMPVDQKKFVIAKRINHFFTYVTTRMNSIGPQCDFLLKDQIDD